jgi:hypothetical protein
MQCHETELALDHIVGSQETFGLLQPKVEVLMEGLQVPGSLEESKGSFQGSRATRLGGGEEGDCTPITKGNSTEGKEKVEGQAGSTCCRVRYLVATQDCWGCGWHPGHHRHQGPTVGRHLSTPAVSTGTGSAPGSAHPGGGRERIAVQGNDSCVAYSSTGFWSAPTNLTCPHSCSLPDLILLCDFAKFFSGPQFPQQLHRW